MNNRTLPFASVANSVRLGQTQHAHVSDMLFVAVDLTPGGSSKCQNGSAALVAAFVRGGALIVCDARIVQGATESILARSVFDEIRVMRGEHAPHADVTCIAARNLITLEPSDGVIMKHHYWTVPRFKAATDAAERILASGRCVLLPAVVAAGMDKSLTSTQENDTRDAFLALVDFAAGHLDCAE